MKIKTIFVIVCLGCTMILGACLPQAQLVETQSLQPAQEEQGGVGGDSIGEPTGTPTPETVPAFTPDIITPANAAQLVQVGEYLLPSPASRLVWSLDGNMLGVMTSDSLLRFSAPDLAMLGSVQIQAPFVLLDFSPDGATMAATSDWATIHLMSAIDGSLIRTISPSQSFTEASFSPDGQTLVINSTDEFAANLWSVQSGVFMQKYTGFDTAAPVYTVVFASNGRYLIWLARAQLQLTGLNSGQVGVPFYHEDFVISAALNPQGTILAASTDGMVGDAMVPFVKLWDSASGDDLGTLQNPSMAQSVAFSPDGSLLAAGQWIWDVQGRVRLFDIGDTAGTGDCRFSPDGRILAAVSNEGKLTLWQTPAP